MNKKISDEDLRDLIGETKNSKRINKFQFIMIIVLIVFGGLTLFLDLRFGFIDLIIVIILLRSFGSMKTYKRKKGM